jgi:hypothetical protein
VEVPIISPALTAFTHRPFEDGTIASFCNKCFTTIATAQWEADLEQAEQAHVCDPRVLDYWRALANERLTGVPGQS